MKKKYLECGKIVSTHGIQGEIKIQHWCDYPEYLCGFEHLYLDNGAKKLEVERARVHKGMVMLKIAGIGDIDSAAALRGKTLYLDRDNAPEDGETFLQDILGAEVRNADSGEAYGTLSDVFETGANDVYEITRADGGKLLFPAIPQVLVSRDAEAGIVLIRPLRGLFGDED